ncbi:TadE/TadG family type IV pilus assembly protein [Halalkalibacter alkaliphilus]|uniref:Pilus assembly protein n=1 Tax=Halalkalibacter alkaliphilus TaxID=2917993 RepID=A0A9X2A6W2_9BACI|nr:TadE family protein [Halalkalibacter alkaliphilus]MCL7746731.1 pilus assembly protein [Halalkalibacter alkaliphilus]
MIRSEKGQAVVELALTMTVLVFLIFGIIDFGRIFHAYLTLEHASREGARVASVGGTNAEVVQRIREASPSLRSENITIAPISASRTRGSYVTIDLSYPVSFSIPVFKSVLPDPLTLRSKTVMRVE